MTDKEARELAAKVTKEFANRGLVIEAGWQAYFILAELEQASQVQKDETRKAFYAGAQHLFGSIMSILEPGAEPTDADLNRLTLISEELNRWLESIKKQN